MITLAALACSQLGPPPTIRPPPASASASPSPGPETPTPRPETLTQPAVTDETPATLATPSGTPLPPLGQEVFSRVAAIGADLSGAVVDMRFTPDGTLWLLTDQAVARLAGNTWEIYLHEYGGELVGIDDLNRVWVAGADGASIEAWNGEEWQGFGNAEGWAQVTLGPTGSVARLGLVADQLGRVWLATGADVRAFDGETWQVFDRASLGMAEAVKGESSPHFTLHVTRRDGTVWVSECDQIGPGPSGGGGVRWYDGTNWLGAGSPVEAGCGWALTSSAQGPVWVGLDAAVLEFDPVSGEWTTYDAPAPPRGERFGFVADLALDLSERPWPLMAICGGASCDGGRVRYRVAEDGTWAPIGEAGEEPQSLLFDIAGGGWLLSEAGAQRATGGQLQPAGDMRVLAAAQDSAGQIYVVGEQAGDMALWLVRPGNE